MGTAKGATTDGDYGKNDLHKDSFEEISNCNEQSEFKKGISRVEQEPGRNDPINKSKRNRNRRKETKEIKQEQNL